ncbi:MAG: hypothetical protein KF789_00240 [Bdellovibrionaceae bacterium]|nr:hypothetical protein [Pseudobdellovibrionaceae bacterium]
MRNFWAVVLLIFSFEAMAVESSFHERLEALLTEDIVFTGPNCFNSAL